MEVDTPTHELTSSTVLPDIALNCFMSQDNIDRAKAHRSYCLFALPIKEAFWHEHDIPPGKSQVQVDENGKAWATINGVRYVGLVTDYGLVQRLDAAAASGDIEEMAETKASIKPHAFTVLFKPHHHLHTETKPPAESGEREPQAEPKGRATQVLQVLQSNPGVSDKEASEQTGADLQTVQRVREKATNPDDKKQAQVPSGPKAPQQRVAHRAKPFLPKEIQ